VFNTNIAALYPRIAAARVKPNNLWSGDDEAGVSWSSSASTPATPEQL
jgi:hypothetical protein